MSDTRLGILAAALLLTPGAAFGQDRAQDLPRLRELRARVVALQEERAQSRLAERERAAAARAAALYRHGNVRLVAHGDPALLTESARLADSMMSELGVFPSGYVDGLIFVELAAGGVDSIVAAAGPSEHHLPVDLAQLDNARDIAWNMMNAAGFTYRRRLQLQWLEWLPADFGLGWVPEREGMGAMQALTESNLSMAQHCLGGDAASCLRWLALDPGNDPYGSRYEAADLRPRIAWVNPIQHEPMVRQCLAGEDAACTNVARRHGRTVAEPIPANHVARASVLRAVRQEFGAEALRRALTDSTGSLGERLSRATGVSADSIARSWRTWVLRRGHADRIEASLADGLVALLTAGLFAALAARSGRWR